MPRHAGVTRLAMSKSKRIESAHDALGHTGTRLIAASGFLLQSIQESGLDPFSRVPRLVDDFPALIVALVLIVEYE